MTLTMEAKYTPWAWNNMTFTQLFKMDPKKAFEYRFNCNGTPIPSEYCNEEIEVWETKTEYSKEDLIKLLKDNDIKFFPWAKIEKLIEKCVENSLI